MSSDPRHLAHVVAAKGRRGAWWGPPPSVAVEIAAGHVSAARFTFHRGGLQVAAHACESLPAGAVTVAANADNVADAGVVTGALRRAFDRIGARPGRVALAIPAGAVKVSLLKFESVPRRADDVERLLRWQMRKAAPFNMDDAQLSYSPGSVPAEGGVEFIVVAARRDVVRQYESVVEAGGGRAGIVDVTTFNVLNAVLAGAGAPVGDWLLVHVTPGAASVGIVRDGHLVLFRHRSHGNEQGLAELAHQTAMYYEDRLHGGGLTRGVLAGAGLLDEGAEPDRHAEQVRRTLQERVGVPVEFVDPRGAARLDHGLTTDAGLLDTLAPLVGLIARERRA